MIWELIIILVFNRIIQVWNLKCYACASENDSNCENEANKTATCTNAEMKEELKEVFKATGHEKVKLNGESCISLEYEINQGTHKFMRTCIPAKDCQDESVTAFVSMSGYGKFKSCNICFTDFCNNELFNTGGQFKSSVIFMISTSFIIKLFI